MKDSHTSQQLIDFYHFEAKRLHRAAQSRKKLMALPVLRRLLKHGVITDISLVQVFANQNLIKRKHLFNLLAKEVGFNNWPELKAALEKDSKSHTHFALKSKNLGYPNLWFTNVEQANEYAKSNGGEVIDMSGQAIVVGATS